MLSELRNRRLYVIGGLAALFVALALNFISFTSVICILIILGCGTITLRFALNENRRPFFSSISSSSLGTNRNFKSAIVHEADTSARASRRYKSGSRSQSLSRNRGTAEDDTMSSRQFDRGLGSSRLSRSFGAVKSFLRSPKIAFGASSPMFSPKVGALNSPSSPASLPKVHRIRDSFHSGASAAFDSRPMASAHRRYPTHQPQYSGLGMMPPVNFHKTDRPILSERNTNMIHSPVTVKIAPPDVLKPPVPSLIPATVTKPSPGPSSDQQTQQPCNTASVLSAIREKRKRNHKDDSVVQSPEPAQESKRRRQADFLGTEQQKSTGAVAMDTDASRVKGLKRPAISKAREESINEMEKSAKRSRANSPMSGYASTSGARNAIDCSFSSSRRWLEKQVAGQQRVTRSQSREIDSPVKRGRSPGRETSKSKRVTRSASRSRGDSPHVEKHVSSSQDVSRLDNTNVEESFSAANTSTPLRDTSGNQETKQPDPMSEIGDETPQIENVIKKKLFPLKKGSSSKRRQTPIFSPSTSNFSKVPSLRYNLTVEDYAEDREADMQRVQQMLQDVDEPDTPKDSFVSTSKASSTAVPEAGTSATSSINLAAAATTPATSSALAALLDNTPGIPATTTNVPVSSSISTSSGMTLRSSVAVTSTAVISTQVTATPTLTKSPTSSNLTNIGGDVTTSTASLQSPMLATGAPKLPTFAEATAKTTTPAAGSTAPQSQFTYKPVFATEQSVGNTSATGGSLQTATLSTNPVTTASSSVSVAFGTTTTSTAATGIFSFGTTPAASSAAPTPSSTSVFETKAPTGGFQFNVDPPKTTTNTGPFQFNTAPSTKTASSALPSYSSAVSSSATPSSTFSFGSTGSTSQTSAANTSSATSFNFTPSGTGITFGNTGGTFPSSSSVAPTTNVGTFGQTTAVNVPKTTASGIFTFGASSNQGQAFGQQAVSTTASAPSIFGQAPAASATSSVFGQTTKQPTIAFGQPAPNNTTSVTGGIFGAPKKEETPQQSSAFQFTASTKQPAQSSSAFNFTANSTKQGATTSASSTFSFSTTKANDTFGSGNAFGQTNAPTFGTTTNTTSTPFGQQPAQSTFGQSSQNAFGQANNQGAFGQKGSGQGIFGQQSTSQSGFGSTTQTPFGSQSAQNGFGKTGSAQNVFGASSSTTFGATSQSQPSKGFDFAAASGTSKTQGGFDFGSAGGFGTPQTPAGGSAPAFGSPAPTNNPFNTAPSTPQNMFSVASSSTAPRPRAVARTARRRTTKR